MWSGAVTINHLDAMDSNDRMRFCICCLCGLPGSGKSTVCEQLNLKLQENYLILQLNFDKILLDPNSDTIKLWDSLDSGQRENGEGILKSARTHILNLVEFLIQKILSGDLQEVIRETPKPGYIDEDVWNAAMAIIQENVLNCNFHKSRQVLFLLDDNMYLWSMRYEYYKIARLYRIGFCEIYVKSSIEKAKERNKSRHGRDYVDDDVIERMSKKFEVPDSSKKTWEKFCSVLDTDSDVNLIGAIQIIEEAFANPAHPSPEIDAEERLHSQTVCSANFIHQVDLILRKCVSKIMMKGKNSSGDLRHLSKQVSSVKENILSLLKNGDLCIPESVRADVRDSSKDENSDMYKSKIYFRGLGNEIFGWITKALTSSSHCKSIEIEPLLGFSQNDSTGLDKDVLKKSFQFAIQEMNQGPAVWSSPLICSNNLQKKKPL